MRPIKLSMTAFGAYVKPTTIDFAKDLRGERIFLITGATGAGKTTILDAITYALYGETSGKVRDVKDMRSKGVADNVLTEVEFIFALGDKTFQIKREISYHPNRKDNKFQTTAALYCDKNLIDTKERAVKNKVTELLGFNAEQFRQVVLLPQGEFKKFLSADADDRQEVLNVLFDSTPYKKIEDALSDRAKNSNEEVKALETKLETLNSQLSGADSQALSVVEEKFSAAQAQVAQLKEISDKAQTALSEGKILLAKFAEQKKAASDLNAAQIQFAESEKIFVAAQAEYQTREAQESQRKELDKKIGELKEVRSTLDDLEKKNATLGREKAKLEQAKTDFELYDGREKKYDKRLEELKAQKAKLVGADVKFEQDKQTLEKARKSSRISREIARLQAELSMETEKLSAVNEKLKAAQIELTRLQIVESAARLAAHLKDGEPCPVCGSLEHPAISENAIPTAAELQRAEENVQRLDRERTQQERTVAQVKGRISSQKNLLEDYIGVPDVETAQKNHDDSKEKAKRLAECQDHIEDGEKFIKKNKADLTKATTEKNSATATVAKLEGAISEAKKKIPENYMANAQQLDDDLNAAQKIFDQLDAAWKLADKNFHAAEKIKSARQGALNNAQKNLDAIQIALQNKTPPEIETLEQSATESRQKYDAALDEKAKLENTLNTLKKFSAERDEVQSKLDAARKVHDMWRRLSDVANATGKGESELKISFQRYFLSTMFKEVVDEANNRLKKMSNGRYLFQMKDAGKTKAKSAGLNLEIFDEYTGAFRPVETLSGGESFLASLSLALGLASVVRNKVGGIKLDTIFIDEGFGSLDSETLDFATSTIIEQSGGRLVGIISHVEELKSQIPVRLEITKEKTGSTAKFK